MIFTTVHEMRNQLAIAVANIEAFIDGKIEPTPARLGAVLGALTKLDTLMNELRQPDTAEKPTARLGPIDVCGLIANEAIGMEAAANAAGIRLDVDLCTTTQPGCAHFTCDGVQVSQVIKNVLLNALHYTGRGGTVRLTCHPEPGCIALDVCDNGPGVRIEEREAIFERGIRGTASATHDGTGVGLAVAREILRAHGGTVTVDDSPDGGARFLIRLPGETAFRACDACSTPTPPAPP